MIWQNLFLAFVLGWVLRGAWSAMSRNRRRGVPMRHAIMPERRRAPNVTEVP